MYIMDAEGAVHFGFTPMPRGTKINVNAGRNLDMSRGLIVRRDNGKPNVHAGCKICCSHFALNVLTISPTVLKLSVGLSFVWADEATLKKSLTTK